MWFDFKISSTRISLIVLAVVTIANNFVKPKKIAQNDNTAQSLEKFMDDLYDRNNNTHTLNKPMKKSENIKNDIENVPPSVVLMMKLISYYEDKFNIANHEPTEVKNKLDISNKSNKRIQRIGLKYKISSDHNIIIPDVIIA